MKNLKWLTKKIIPKNIWEFSRKRKALFFDIVFNLGAKVCTTKYFGFVVYYNRGNSLIDRLREEKYFEKELCQQIIRDLEHTESKQFLDIGANIGLITVSVLANVKNVKVDCFEPGPLQFGFLEKTMKENELLSQVTVHREALGRSIGTEKFFIHEGADIAKDGFKNTGRGEGGREITVSATTLDVWWQQAGKPHISVIKMDTEGAELFILQGGREFLSEIKPILYLEIEPTNLAIYPYTAKDIIQFLTTVGYRVSTLGGTHVTEKNIDELTKCFDTYKASPLSL